MNFIQQSYKGKTDLWRWLLLTGLFLTPYFKDFLIANLVAPLVQILPDFNSKKLLSNLLVYLIIFPVFILLFNLLHKREFITLITNRNKVDWLRFWLSFVSWCVFSVLMFSIPLFLSPSKYEFRFQLISFLLLLVIFIVIVPFQVFFLTIFLRSYLLQFFSCFIKRPIYSLFFVVVVFSFLMYNSHIKHHSVVSFLMLMHYVILGFVLGLIILLDEGLEIVLGMTLATSLVSIFFVNYKNAQANSYALFIKEGGMESYLVFIACFVSYPLYVYFLHRVYNWKNWKEKLFNKIEKPIV